MHVLIACEFSGVVREAFIARGHDAWSCDLLTTDIPGPHFQMDVFDVIRLYGPWDLMIAHPPCTDICVSGNPQRAVKEADGRTAFAIQFVKNLANVNIHRIAIENPVGLLSTRWRKPDQYIQPWQFGHDETKKTGFWLKNLPLLKPTNDVGCDYKDKIHKMAKTPMRGYERSRTYPGIAAAMAEQWGK
jgi:site-specific DNA-cytosine methylase